MKEFDFIEQLLKPIAGKNSFGLRDDCAFFDGYAITKDVLVEGIHFFSEDNPQNLAKKALRVNLSDLASCGAEPFGFMLGLGLTNKTNQNWLKNFVKGLEQDIKKYNFQLLGGDTVSTKSRITISVTAIGKVNKPVTRAGAKLNDNIFVTGKIGAGVLGLKSKIEGKGDAFSKHYELPTPRLDMTLVVRKYANACIDISDGLLADLGHICKESGYGAEIFSRDVPLYNGLPVMDLLTGGDDYQLLFTSKQNAIKGCYKIGKIVKGKGIKLDGKRISPKGYQHKI